MENTAEGRMAMDQFKRRMEGLEDDLRDINRALGAVDLLALAHRTRELLRQTKGLLDGNVNVLFADQPARVAEELYKHVEYAEGHLHHALGEEVDFERIRQRLFMATFLSDFVIRGVQQAVENIERTMTA